MYYQNMPQALKDLHPLERRLSVHHLQQKNQVNLEQKKQSSKQRVTIIRTKNPSISGLYVNGIKIDELDKKEDYLIQELVCASDASFYDKEFFIEESDMKYAWEQSRFINEIETAIIEHLLIEEE